MVNIRKEIYSNLEFEEEQAAHQKKIAALLDAERNEIVQFLLKTNEYFRRDGPEVTTFFFERPILKSTSVFFDEVKRLQ